MAPPKQVFLFDMTRHRSHLFFRYLGTHPALQSLWHPFLPAFLFGPERITNKTKNGGERGDSGEEWIAPRGKHTYAEATDHFMAAVEDAATNGKILVANEHTQMVHKQDITLAVIRDEDLVPSPDNPTVIPDHIFETLTPVFIIRNPVFSTPSNYKGFAETSTIRPGDEDWKAITAINLQRRLFDYFKLRDGRAPLVIDGDDVVWRTKEVGKGLCQALDIDFEGLSETWEAVPENERSEDPVIKYFLQTIDDSTGIERSTESPPNADVDKAHGKWVEAYGEEIANELMITAKASMPHYDYLRQFKI